MAEDREIPGSRHRAESPEDGMPFDPREFTFAEWNIIREALVDAAQRLEWRAKRPRIGKGAVADLEGAADRRYDIAFRCIRARRFRKNLLKAVEEGVEAGAVDA